MSRKSSCILLAVALVVVILATFLKHFDNDFSTVMYNAYNTPTSTSAEDARGKAVLLTQFKVEPSRLAKNDYEYEFGEAWLEVAYRPRHSLIWFSYSERANWSYLCIRPETRSGQQAYSFTFIPEYNPLFVIDDPAVNRRGMAFTPGTNSPGLYFQRVPSDLKAFTGTVSVETYGKGENVTVGTAHFTAKGRE